MAQWRHPRAGTGRGGYGYSYRRYPGSYRGPYSGGYSRSYYGGRYNGGYGRHYSRPYHGSHYRRYSRPYYGGYHYPYYRPYFYSSFYFGWPYYSTWPYYSAWPYYSGSYYPYYPVYDSGYSVPVASPGYYDEPSVTPLDSDRPYDPGDSGRLRLEVRPEDASVYVDDEFRGTAREVRSLILPPGRHAIELVRPGYATERREVEIVRGEGRDLLVDLQRP